MKTLFTLKICHLEHAHAAYLAHKAFEELDLLEGKLSRFIEDSDIARINVMRGGETLYLSEETHACLLLALEYYGKTGGLFDITLGRTIEHRKEHREGPPPAIEGSLIIHPDRPAVTCQAPGRILDLGGIGKGFALDRLKDFLIEWQVESALLAAGASTQLAFGETSWPVEIIGEADRQRIELKNAALSASGTGIQGSHIVHPDGDEQALPWKHVWLTAPTAAAADIWSTALMLLPDPELLELSEITSLYYESESGIEARAS
ncbi:FAD:protein FMN transferase [Haloferula chungangensis]|uniref:FAD:protein FMN transferase n=1 Tax=Haloferula chungangensis TaxID=1048331 RepID=A0ABW2L8G5_9BACT